MSSSDCLAVIGGLIAMGLSLVFLNHVAIPHSYPSWWGGMRCERCHATVRQMAIGQANRRWCRDKFPDWEGYRKAVVQSNGDVKYYDVDDEGNLYEYVDGYRYRVTPIGLIRDKREI